MKQKINVRSKSGKFYGRSITRNVEQDAKGARTCFFKGKTYEVTDNGSGDLFIFVD